MNEAGGDDAGASLHGSRTDDVHAGGAIDARPHAPRRGDHAGDAQPRILGTLSATGVVLASTIGTGIFTTTGFLAADLGSATNVIAAWVLGAIVAITGGLTVAELGAMMPHAGGSYVFARRAFGDVVGYLNGMITILIGYVASITVIALGFAAYLGGLLAIDDPTRLGAIAGLSILTVTIVHALAQRGGARLNDALCILKVGVVVAFIVPGLVVAATAGDPATDPAIRDAIAARPSVPLLSLAVFGGVVTTTFSYLGWSSAAEVGGEVRRPERTIPIAVLGGIGVVALLYLLLNVVFLRAAHPVEMAPPGPDGVPVPIEDIGRFAAERLFGESAGTAFAIAIAVVLASTLSTTTMAGGRVIWAMARRGQLPTPLAGLNERGAPTAALVVQGVVAIAAVAISDLRTMLEYVGILVLIFSMLTMVAVIVLRVREPDAPRPFRVPLYPIPPLVNLAVGGVALVGVMNDDDAWRVVLAAVATIVGIVALMPLLARRPA